MRSLFLKIFLSYWLAQALFVVLAILVTLALRPPRDSSSWEALHPNLLPEAIQAYERGGDKEAREYLEEAQHALRVRAFLFDDQGQEVSHRPAPEWVESRARGVTPRRRGFLGLLVRSRLVSQSAAGPSGRRYTLVVELRPGPRVFFGPHGVPGLGIVIAILSSGLVCYILARYLTAPVARLRTATQQLAAGELSARVPPSRGRDEIAELVRDFNGMAERLETLVNAQSRLLNDISHELRSPLARLNVALGLARQRSSSEAQGALERIEMEANRLNELIGRLLTLSRLEGGAEIMQQAPVRLDELVREIASDADFEAQSRQCHVRCVIGDQGVVMGNASLLHSAIENVVRNAARYTREGTEVEIELEQIEAGTGREAVIRVTDLGPGVPEDALDKLFRPFYRLDDARGRQTGGVGLGLAIAERAVRLHGGTVRAANRPGGGLMVEIRLPLAPQPSPR